MAFATCRGSAYHVVYRFRTISTRATAHEAFVAFDAVLAKTCSEGVMGLFFVGVDVVYHPQDKSPPKDRQAAIERTFHDLKARRALDRLWLVRSSKSAAELLQALKPHFGARDGAVVSEVKGSVAHWWTMETISDLVQCS